MFLDYIKKIILFIVITLSYGVFFILTRGIPSNPQSISHRVTLGFLCVIFTLSIFGLFSISGVSKEKYDIFPAYETSPGKLCRGGPYMWQGNSERAKMCRKLAETAAGQEEIARYDCGAGFVGIPGGGFRYTPFSNQNWENEKCKSLDQPPDINDNGVLGGGQRDFFN